MNDQTQRYASDLLITPKGDKFCDAATAMNTIKQIYLDVCNENN